MSWIDQRPDDAMDGAFAAVAPESFPTVAPVLFREAMSRLGAAVHIITTAGPAGSTGLTATAVCSVSDMPATLLVCVNRRAQSSAIVTENGVFCVNTLHAGQEEIADFFAKRSQDKSSAFAGDDWTTLTTGAPALRTAVVALDCRVVEWRAVATHNVIYAAVEAVHNGPPGPALVYHDRAYKHV